MTNLKIEEVFEAAISQDAAVLGLEQLRLADDVNASMAGYKGSVAALLVALVAEGWRIQLPPILAVD